MLPYLHILIRVEDDGSLHALGAFTSKEKQNAYIEASGIKAHEVRLDFYNGPFEEDIPVVYAGHRRWNMDRFQLGGYFTSEGEAWNEVTSEGYVSVLRVDTTFEEEQALQREALKQYAKLQKRWRLNSYDDLILREGADKARANIVLRFYEDALESFKPRNRRDARALYAFILLILLLPLAVFFFLSSGADSGENVDSVSWLPDYAQNISYYRSNQIQVFEFEVSPENFKRWAESRGMTVRQIVDTPTLSRYSAYTRVAERSTPPSTTPDEVPAVDAWQENIAITTAEGLIATKKNGATAVYNPSTGKAYFEHLIGF